MAEPDSAAAMADNSFDPNWSNTDGAALHPGNLPVKRIARAWERKPHSPYSQKSGARKVWRRARMPNYNLSVPKSDLATVYAYATPEQPVTLESPKKAVKKQCLNTTYGKDWRTTEWDPRGVHIRKQAHRPPIVLRSGAQIDPNSDDEDHVDQDQSGVANDTASEGDKSENQDSEWEDIESDADALDTEREGVYEEEEDHEEPVSRPSEQGITSSDETDAMDTQPLTMDGPDEHASARQTALPEPATTPVDSPLSDELQTTPKPRSPAKKSPAKQSPAKQSPAKLSPKNNFPTKRLPEIPALIVPSLIERPSSAPPEETGPMEPRQRPRISDDTAILHAFLSRAAASKKPIAKRESLTNRRDSGMIRHALASPAKPEVLAERDANSTSPHKAVRQETDNQSEHAVEGKAAASPQKPTPMEERPEQSRPARRSGRSRARPALLLDQMTVEEPVKGPSRITIRGPSEQISLKKNETQELMAQTRSNTRKNKGQSVMPIARLSKLADEANEKTQEVPPKPNQDGKNVRWDETLAYFSESPEEILETAAAQATAPAAAAERATLSPTTTRSTRSSKGAPSPSSISSKSARPDNDDATPKPAAPATKRRSRIATPAKGLLSKSLLPDDVLMTAAITATEPEPSKTGSSAAAAAASIAAPRKRALPTPQRSAAALTSALKQCGASDDDAAGAPLGLASRAPLSPRKAQAQAQAPTSSIPSIAAFAPRMNGDVPKLSFEEALVGPRGATTTTTTTTTKNKKKSGAMTAMSQERDEVVVPGLASPAKRRRGVLMGRSTAMGLRKEMGEEMQASLPLPLPLPLPGLMSPAKKRTRGAL